MKTANVTSGQENVGHVFSPRDCMLQYFMAVVARAVMRATRAQAITTPSRSYQDHYKQPFVTISKVRCPIRNTRLTDTVGKQAFAGPPHLWCARKLVDDNVCGKPPVRPNACSGEFALILLPCSAATAPCLCKGADNKLCHAQSSRGRQDVLPVGRALEHRTHLQHAAHRR